METILEELLSSDGAEVLEIFNYYTQSGFSAYTDEPLPPEAADAFLSTSVGYPALICRRASDRLALGFALLRSHSPIAAFSHTAELTLYVRHGFTGQGIGGEMLRELLQLGAGLGVEVVVATICSLNEGSLRFHLRHGFRLVGRLEGVGEKFGRRFDELFVQRDL